MKDVSHPVFDEFRLLVNLRAVMMTEPAPPDTGFARPGLLPSDGERRVDATGFGCQTRRSTMSRKVWVWIVPGTAVGAAVRRRRVDHRRWHRV
jgi:hypothetical protein